MLLEGAEKKNIMDKITSCWETREPNWAVDPRLKIAKKTHKI